MDHFLYRNGTLHAEDVPLAEIAAAVGTPFYVYSTATLLRHFTLFDDALEGLDHLVCYAMKAASNQAILTTLAQAGAGMDVVSEGEYLRAKAAGVPAEKIVFSGVGKTAHEIRTALRGGIRQFNVESEPEMMVLNAVALELGKVAPITIRVNPNVDARTHAKIATGKSENKFGIPISRAREVYALAATLPGLKVIGIDVHIGSQLTDLEPFEQAYTKVAELTEVLRADGHQITRLDLGGGLGIPYRDGEAHPPAPAAYARAIRDVLDPLDVEIIVEPGRLIAGNAGLLLTRVIYMKDGGVKDGVAGRFVILDAGMNDLIRPALYDAWHEIRPVKAPAPGIALETYDIVGPICETGDTFARARPMAPVVAGDLVAILSAGAYGAAQASEYNGRRRVAEVLVTGDTFAIIRPRRDYDAMARDEQLAPWLG